MPPPLISAPPFLILGSLFFPLLLASVFSHTLPLSLEIRGTDLNSGCANDWLHSGGQPWLRTSASEHLCVVFPSASTPVPVSQVLRILSPDISRCCPYVSISFFSFTAKLASHFLLSPAEHHCRYPIWDELLKLCWEDFTFLPS